MNALQRLLHDGGWVIGVIMILSVLLYSRCCKLIWTLRRTRRRIERLAQDGSTSRFAVARARDELMESFRGQRVALGAMIAAAPLLGLLGTVNGMEKTFASIGGRVGDKSMEGFARGISEVLVATESGLAVAIPALAIVYLAHREVHLHVTKLNSIEQARSREEAV